MKSKLLWGIGVSKKKLDICYNDKIEKLYSIKADNGTKGHRELIKKPGKSGLIKTSFAYAVSEVCISDGLKLNIYRIMQEVVNNILKYGAATKVSILPGVRDNILKVSAGDNGKGYSIDDKRRGIGISNMINHMQSFNGLKRQQKLYQQVRVWPTVIYLLIKGTSGFRGR